MSEINDLMPITLAAKQAGVARNTMLLAAKKGKIKATRIGRGWFVFESDLERWKQENYRPEMAYRYPANDEENDSS